MSSFKIKCVEYFGTSDLYEILRIESTATQQEIKKAYHRLSLLVHPDRVEETQKQVATEKFKVLGRIHSILKDKCKRQCYDECGEFDEETDAGFNWMEYWRTLFKPIDIKDIDNYKKEYIGSDIELRDIKRSYVNSKGNMDVMLEHIPFSDCDSEPRIMEIVRKLVDDGEVEEYSAFFDEPKAKKNRRRRKWLKDRKLCEETDWTALQKEVELNREKRLQSFNSLIQDVEARYGAGSKRKSLTNGKASPKRKVTGRKSAKK